MTSAWAAEVGRGRKEAGNYPLLQNNKSADDLSLENHYFRGLRDTCPQRPTAEQSDRQISLICLDNPRPRKTPQAAGGEPRAFRSPTLSILRKSGPDSHQHYPPAMTPGR